MHKPVPTWLWLVPLVGIPAAVLAPVLEHLFGISLLTTCAYSCSLFFILLITHHLTLPKEK